MNYFVQRGKVRSQVINVPEGLPEILQDITREVLRCQPSTECMCQFIIDYLHTVIVSREKARVARSIIERALRSVDEVIEDMCICDITEQKAETLCLAMEECFRLFLAKRRCVLGRERESIKYQEFDILDELIKKCKFSDEELRKARPRIEAAYQKFITAYLAAQENSEGTEALYQYFREREERRLLETKRQRSATQIQALIRGYLVRKRLFGTRQATEMEPIGSDADIEEVRREEAARKIQRFVRKAMRGRTSHDSDNICEKSSAINVTDPFDPATKEAPERQKAAEEAEAAEKLQKEAEAKAQEEEAAILAEEDISPEEAPIEPKQEEAPPTEPVVEAAVEPKPVEEPEVIEEPQPEAPEEVPEEPPTEPPAEPPAEAPAEAPAEEPKAEGEPE